MSAINKIGEQVPDIIKYLPESSLDNITDALKNGKQRSKAEYSKLKKAYEAAGKNLDDVFGTTVKHIDDINFKPQNLIDELIASGKKCNLDEIEFVVKTPDGNILWLEKGNESRGLYHILHGAPDDPGHIQDFANRGIDDIKTFLYNVVQSNPVKIGQKIRGNGRIDKWAEYIVNGKKYLLAYGDNGFIVSFYPV